MGGRGSRYNRLIKQAEQNVEQVQREDYTGEPVNYKDFLTDPESEIQDEMFQKLKAVGVSTRQSTDDVNRKSLEENQKEVEIIANEFSYLIKETYQDVQLGSENLKQGTNGQTSSWRDNKGLLLRVVLDKHNLKDRSFTIEQQKRDLNSNWSAPIPPTDKNLNTYTVVHEMGHVIENCIFERLMKLNQGNSFYYDTRKVATKIRTEVEKICKNKYTKPGQEVIMNISDYSIRNSKEWFAETFTNLILADKPVPVALALDDFIRRFEHYDV